MPPPALAERFVEQSPVAVFDADTGRVEALGEGVYVGEVGEEPEIGAACDKGEGDEEIR